MIKTDVDASILRKYDRRILPLVAILYFLAFFPRVNVSNLNKQLVQNLDISDDQFSILLSSFFFGYTLMEMPSNICLKKYSPPRWLALICLCWGIAGFAAVFSKNFAHVLISRILVGCFEAGIFPGILYYLSLFYLKSERGLRFSGFFLSGLIAAAFSGLIAFALLGITKYFQGWQWVIIVESLPSILYAPLIWFWLPSSPADCHFLDETERRRAIDRMHVPEEEHEETEDDFSGDPLSIEYLKDAFSSENSAPVLRQSEKFREVAAAFGTAVIWLFALAYLCLSIPMAAISFFLPKIVELVGFDSIKANLVTVPLYILAAVFVLFMSRHSDRHKERPFHIAFACLISMSGYAGLSYSAVYSSSSTLDISLSLLYTQMTVAGTACTIPLCCVWLTEAFPSNRPTLLATASAFMVTFGQLSGIITPWVYDLLTAEVNGRASYVYGHLAMGCSMFTAVLLMLLVCYKLKKTSFEYAVVPAEDAAYAGIQSSSKA